MKLKPIGPYYRVFLFKLLFNVCLQSTSRPKYITIGFREPAVMTELRGEGRSWKAREESVWSRLCANVRFLAASGFCCCFCFLSPLFLLFLLLLKV